MSTKDSKHEQLCTLQSVINWVAVTDRLPKEYMFEVLVIIDGQICCRQFDPETGFYNHVVKMNIDDCVTHWAAYPEPPCL